jgi:hypothetical protein
MAAVSSLDGFQAQTQWKMSSKGGTLMIRFALLRIAVGIFSLALVLPASAKDKADDPNTVDGKIWHYELSLGKKKERGRFRVQGGDLFNGDAKVGTIKPTSDKTSTIIFKGHRDFTGKADVRRVERRPPVWEGTLHKDDGTDWQMRLEIQDR